MKTVTFCNTIVQIGDNGQFFLSANKDNAEERASLAANTSVALCANPAAEIGGIACGETPDSFAFDKAVYRADGITTEYYNQEYKLRLAIQTEWIANCVRQHTRLINEGTRSVKIARLAAATVPGIGRSGRPWYTPDRFKVHICYNRWQGEGQWQTRTLKECGLYPRSAHVWDKSTFRIQSTGSKNTEEYYPIFIIEDCDRGECWFFEREGAENWFMEITALGGFSGGSLAVTPGGADEATNWKYDLMPGETYETTAAVYGVVKGGFEQAVWALTNYKRATSLVPADVAVTFNDYMNCNWARPTRDNLIPLIDKASELGVKRFCIDDGWAEQGVYKPLDDLFGEGGLQGIIDYIRSKGMVPGLWFEFERSQCKLEQESGEKDFLLRRDGDIVAKQRPKLNFCNKKAVAYVSARIDEAYKMGVRFIKNDHNNDEWVGTQTGNESCGEGLRRNEQAFYAFIDALHQKYPDLIIENCGSGGMRSDNGTLRHFALQSTSDQEDYRLYPSVAVGSLALMPPEKAGMWSYPYPLRFARIGQGMPSDYRDAHADGRETVFNMVTGMTGQLYLSGRIDLADEYNTRLMREGIEVYNAYKDSLCERFAVFPTGQNNMDETRAVAVGLYSPREHNTILAVWALTDKTAEIPLPVYRCVRRMYPAEQKAAWAYKAGKLRVQFASPYSAALFLCEE